MLTPQLDTAEPNTAAQPLTFNTVRHGRARRYRQLPNAKLAMRERQVKAPVVAPLTAYDWTGFYLGGHIGYALGNSNFTATTTPGAPSVSGSLDLFQGFDGFKEKGSFFEGLQVGYNYMFQNRLVIGVEAGKAVRMAFLA